MLKNEYKYDGWVDNNIYIRAEEKQYKYASKGINVVLLRAEEK